MAGPRIIGFVRGSAAACAAVAVAFAALGTVFPGGAGASTHATASAAIAVAAFVGGLPAGLLAVALCGVVVAYGHLPPIGVFHVDHVDELLGLLLFIVNGVLVAGMASLMRERVVRRRRPEGMPASVPRRNAGRAATVVMSEVGLPLGDVPVESLTEREVEVLELVAAGMSNDEIAGALFLSVNTVKTHLKNVYGKLGVASRTQAVARAQELGIIGIGVLVRADPKSRARPPERRAGPPCPARRRVGPRSSHRRARHRRARDVGPTRRCARARR